MTQKDIAALSDKATAATAGPWRQASERGSDSTLIEQPDTHGAFIADAYEEWDAAYIAAASPDKVLWLIAELDKTRHELERRKRSRHA